MTSRYIPLSEACDLACTGSKPFVDVFGVITSHEKVRKSRGSDFVCVLYVTDASLEGFSNDLEVVCFGLDRKALPDVRENGDIIRLSRVQVGTFNGKAQAVCQLKRQSPSRFCLFHGGEGRGDEPYQDPGRHYALDSTDKQVLHALRQLSLRKRNAQATTVSEPGTCMCQIKDLWRVARNHPNQLVDIICKVIAIDYRESLPWGMMLCMWDGSDAEPGEPSVSTPIPQLTNYSLQSPKNPSLKALPLASEHPHTEKIAAQLPALGSILPVLVPAEMKQEVMSVITQGNAWFKLKSLALHIVQGQVQAVYWGRSKANPRPSLDRESHLREQEHAQRLQEGRINSWAPVEPQGFLTECDCAADLPVSSIRQVLMAAGGLFAGIFHINARVLRYYPNTADGMCLKKASVPLPLDEAGSGSHTYAVKLLLEDATGQLDAALMGQQAERFFGAPCPTPPAACCSGIGSSNGSSDSQLQRLERQLKALTRQHAEHSVWIDCCISSSYWQDGGPAWDKHFYRLVQTRMKPV